MTDRDALYRAILADPDDETLRLVYADALEEADEPETAAFVREQVRLARLPEYDRAWAYALARGTTEPPAGLRRALPPLPEGLTWPRNPFRGGFPTAVSAASASAFLAHADELFARFPLDSLSLDVARLAEGRDFAESRWLPRLRRLAISEGLSAPAAERFFASQRYERLRELVIGAGLTTPATAASVVRSPVFRRLTSLAFRVDRDGGQALVQELIRLADPPRLRSLSLAGSRLTGEQLPRLLSAPVVEELAELELSDSGLEPDDLSALAACRLPHLRALRLQRTRAGVTGLHGLATFLKSAAVTVLAVNHTHLPAAAMTILAECSALERLHTLELREDRIDDSGAQALARSQHLDNLVRLDLAENLIGDAGADALARAPALGGLLELNLQGNPISPPLVDRLRQRFGAALTI